jgi:hypothetical protein
LPALKRMIQVEALLRSAKALLPPHKCGGSTTNPAVFRSSPSTSSNTRDHSLEMTTSYTAILGDFERVQGLKAQIFLPLNGPTSRALIQSTSVVPPVPGYKAFAVSAGLRSEQALPGSFVVGWVTRLLSG